MYEMFEHTADVGLRVAAGDLDTLFADAARGLFSLLVGDLDAVRGTQPLPVRLEGTDLAYLLFDWLSELLFAFETRRVLLARFDVQVSATGLEATAWGEPWDPARHRLEHEVKAVTYHGLKVEEDGGTWVAEVVLDI